MFLEVIWRETESELARVYVNRKGFVGSQSSGQFLGNGLNEVIRPLLDNLISKRACGHIGHLLRLTWFDIENLVIEEDSHSLRPGIDQTNTSAAGSSRRCRRGLVIGYGHTAAEGVQVLLKLGHLLLELPNVVHDHIAIEGILLQLSVDIFQGLF